MVVSVEGDSTPRFGRPVALFTGDYSFGAGPRFDVSPDGQSFLMMKNADQTDQITEQTTLVVIENWFDSITVHGTTAITEARSSPVRIAFPPHDLMTRRLRVDFASKKLP